MDGVETNRKHELVLELVKNLRVKDVRHFFSHLRKNPDAANFFPAYGITAGEFAIAYVMKMPARCRTARA
jgi:hypothetical protein